jgi:hypothetical protein
MIYELIKDLPPKGVMILDQEFDHAQLKCFAKTLTEMGYKPNETSYPRRQINLLQDYNCILWAYHVVEETQEMHLKTFTTGKITGSESGNLFFKDYFRLKPEYRGYNLKRFGL